MFKKSFPIAIFIAIILLNVFAATPSHAKMEPGPGTGYATIYISPQTNNFTSPPTTVGTKFTVQVRLHNYTHVAAWQVKLVFDKSLLNITLPSTDVSYASDHVFPPGTYSPIPGSVSDFNSTHIYVMMTAATFGSAEYSGMDAGLMRVQFTIIKTPDRAKKLSCPLWIEPIDTWTTDTNIDENSEERIDGLYEIVSSIPPHRLLHQQK